MAISAGVDARRAELLKVARLQGENLARQAFGEKGPDLQVSLADLEQLLRPIVSAVAEGFLSRSAEEQTQRLAETLACPDCGRECPRAESGRTMRGEHARFTWNEVVCHCSHCERNFFPSAKRTQD